VALKVAGFPRLRICIRSTTMLHCGDATCSSIKILEQSRNQNHGIVKELHGGRWWIAGSKAVWIQTAFDGPTITCLYGIHPRVAHGSPLGVKPHPDPDERSVNEKGVVVETSNHSINRRRGGSGRGDRTVSPRYHDGRFFL
jgi:hypothetical protein